MHWTKQEHLFSDWLIEFIDWVMVVRRIRHKIGHFGDVPQAIPQANLLAWYGETQANTKAHIY